MSFGFARFRAPTFADVAAGRDNNLNLLRMLAASSVLFSHSYALTGHMLQEPLVVASGQRTDAATIGVIVFFAISGFLIAQSLARTPSLYAYTIARAAAHPARPDARQAVPRARPRMVRDVARQCCLLDACRHVAVPAGLS